MGARLDFFAEPGAGKLLKQLMAIGGAFRQTAVPVVTQELVALRVSQINGCAACVDMHTKEAVHAGETHRRLHLVAVWRETDVFDDAERAALELAEQATRIADGGGVSDEVWERAAKHYDSGQLTSLVMLISFMNLANRLNVVTRQPVGDYQAGTLR